MAINKSGNMNPHWKGGKTKHICKKCDNEFMDYKSNNRKFCSKSCTSSFLKNGFKKGHKQLNTGRTHFKKNDKRITGENSYNWRGGITSKEKLERTKFRQTIQKQVLERDDYTCQMCGERGVKLQVDHIQPWSEYVELRFNIDNCRTLCMDCHYLITFGKQKPKQIIWGHNLSRIIK